jgi:hypothetical protein
MGIPNAKYDHYEIFNYIAIVLVGYGEIIALFQVYLKKYNSIQIITPKRMTLKKLLRKFNHKTQKVFMFDLTHTESVPNFLSFLIGSFELNCTFFGELGC